MINFSDSERSFLNDEFGLTEKDLSRMSEKDLLDLQDKAFEIETDEIMDAGDGPLSQRGRTARSIVDTIHGPYDSAEFDAEMAEPCDYDDDDAQVPQIAGI